MARYTIDSHQHFWNYDPVRDAWITDDMQVLQQDFLPAGLQPLLQENNVNGCVAVQASETDEETSFLLRLAAANPFIMAVVGWVDLESAQLEKKLVGYRGENKLKGFRPMLQSDPKRDRMLDPAFRSGIRLLQEYGYTCDLIILPDQLGYAADLASLFPEMKFVIDHLAKPPLKKGGGTKPAGPSTGISAWKKDISRFAGLGNVYCKISGLVTEANWNSWTKEDFYPVTDHVVETFGTSRIMFGSDWPVCLLAADYAAVLSVTEDYFTSFPPEEKNKFFSGNARDFYSLSDVV